MHKCNYKTLTFVHTTVCSCMSIGGLAQLNSYRVISCAKNTFAVKRHGQVTWGHIYLEVNA